MVGTAASLAQSSGLADARGEFEATFFNGLGIDSFAAEDLRRYLNPEESNDIGERYIFGFSFDYRLRGGANVREPQVWIYGETVHGVRSSDVDCAEDPDLAPCRELADLTAAPQRSLYILRNARSLEGMAGVRVEFPVWQKPRESPARLYLKGQLGFLSVAGGGGDVLELYHGAVGLVAVNGPNVNSYLEVGYGRSDFFHENRSKRVKIDGLLSWETPVFAKQGVAPFAQITVDADFKGGADSIQSYLGFDLDLARLFLGTAP